MSKLFSNLLYKDKGKDKDKNKSSSENLPNIKGGEKSKPMIIFGFIVSLSSIFLLLLTINNKFG